MRYLLIMIMMAGCAPAQQQQPQIQGYSMTWSCNGNVKCTQSMHAWSGSGSFSNETDCLAWETAFLNSYGQPYDSVSACTAYY